MKHVTLEFAGSFEVALTSDQAQAAVMTLAPSEATGGDDNVHKGSDQWLYVVSGSGEAVIAGKLQSLTAHSLLLIAAGEPHEIRNTGDTPLQTLNFYTPPEY